MSNRIREALHCIPADDRDMWLRMGMAVKSELGDEGFALWDEWSQSASNYKERDARAVWKSIKPGGGITIGTLFHEAQKNGWRDEGTHQKPTPEEMAARQRKAEERRATEEAGRARERAETKAKAAAILKAATKASQNHPYLARKQIPAVATLREIDASAAEQILGYAPRNRDTPLCGRLLVVPVKQGEGISTLELIDGDGRKAALAGRGSKAGGYWASQRLPDGDGAGLRLLVGEGVATVLSASLASECPAIAALSSGNLPAVARAMRARYPAAALVILADLVKESGQPDPHAVQAARETGARLAVPDFGDERPDGATDFNDLHQHAGKDAVKRCIDAAQPVDKVSQTPGKQSAPAGEYAREVILTRASDMRPEPITWLWNEWLACGKLHILGGAPGTGKTTIALNLAATVTTGGQWPDGTQSPTGNVAIWSGEDDARDTLLPRLMAAGADCKRVHFIDGTREGTERQPFDPASDVEPLRRKLAELKNVRLLIVDPIVSAVTGDSHKNAEVRRSLQPLADLAEDLRCALIGITHFSKGTGGRNPVERLTGSLAFGALARVVMVAAKSQNEAEDGRSTRIFCRAKSNIGRDDGGFEYDLQQTKLPAHPGIIASAVQWGDALEGAARELLAEAEATDDDGEGGTLADAKQFLTDLLRDGALPSKTIRADADGAGYSWATIRRAQKALGIEAVKEGMKGGWVWRLRRQPETPKMLKNPVDAQQKNVSTFGKIEHLREDSGVVEVEI